MTVLSVNLNKVALLRNARDGNTPDIAAAATTVIDAGGAGITVHPRPDQRHIRPADVATLRDLLTGYPQVEYNIEGNPFAGPRDNGYPGFDALIESARPAQATLVPDADGQLTSDHGWDLAGDNARLMEHIAAYQRWGARVSLFTDTHPATIEQAKRCGADRVELYTGPFADLAREHGIDHPATRDSFEAYLGAARYAKQVGLGVNAGHDLNQINLRLFRAITEVDEVSIGHALINDALFHGLADTVRAYLAVLAGGAPPGDA